MNIASLLDHAALHPNMTDAELKAECELAKHYQTASICIKPYAVPLAYDILKDSPVKVCTVIGFPHGNSSIDVKLLETEQAIKEGATEIDMVVNIGKVNSEDWLYVTKEIQTITQCCHSNDVIIKVIFENTYINSDDYKIRLCEICTEAKVDFVKTSTGFDFVKQADGSAKTIGATIEDCTLMKKHISESMEVKASGGIKTKEDIEKLLAVGVTRFGTSSTKALLS